MKETRRLAHLSRAARSRVVTRKETSCDEGSRSVSNKIVKTYDLLTYDDVTEVVENGTRTLLVSKNPPRALSEELERLRDDGWTIMSVASPRENRLLVVVCREAA